MTTRYVSSVDTAKEIRKALKANFPNTKFAVRTDKYSGGASVRVYIESGDAVRSEVEAVCNFFSGATFDGSTDSMDYHTRVYQNETVYWGANFVFVIDERNGEY